MSKVDGELVQKALSLCVTDPERVTPVEREVKSIVQAYQALGDEIAAQGETEGRTAQFYAYEQALRDYAYGGVAIFHAVQGRNEAAVRAAEEAEKIEVRLRANKAADKLVEAAKSAVAEEIKTHRAKRPKVEIDEAREEVSDGPATPATPPAVEGGPQAPGGPVEGTNGVDPGTTPVDELAVLGGVIAGKLKAAGITTKAEAQAHLDSQGTFEPILNKARSDATIEGLGLTVAPVEPAPEPVAEPVAPDAPAETPAPDKQAAVDAALAEELGTA